MANDVTWELNEQGNLVVTWDAEARTEELMLAALHELGLAAFLLDEDELFEAGVEAKIMTASYHDFIQVMDGMIKEGFMWITPSDVGALTDAPMLGEDVRLYADVWEERMENGEEIPLDERAAHNDCDVASVKQAYAYMSYEVRSPMDDFIRFGAAIFTRGFDYAYMSYEVRSPMNDFIRFGAAIFTRGFDEE